jgi:hypothetical protein
MPSHDSHGSCINPIILPDASHGLHMCATCLLCSQAAGKDSAAAAELHQACRDVGFFYVKNHGALQQLCCALLPQIAAYWVVRYMRRSGGMSAVNT